MNTVDVSLNLSGGNLSLSGTINNNSVSGSLKEVSGYIPSDYTGTYYIGDGQNGNEIQITSDGYVINKGYDTVRSSALSDYSKYFNLYIKDIFPLNNLYINNFIYY